MSNLRVTIDYEGTEQGAAQIAALVRNLTAADAAQEQTKRSTRALAQEQANLSREIQAGLAKFSAISSSIGQVGAAVGRLGPEFSRLGAIIGETGQTAQQFANAIGSQDPVAAVGALISLTTTLFDAADAFLDYNREQREAINLAHQMARGTTARAREIRDQMASIESQRAPSALHIAMAETERARLSVARAELEVDRLRQGGRVEEFLRAEAARRAAQSALDRHVARENEITGALQQQRDATRARAQDEADLTRLRRQQARELEEQQAILEEAGLGRSQSRRSRTRTRTFAQQEAEAWREAEERHRIYQDAIEEGLAEQEERQRQAISVEQQLHDNRMARLEQERTAIQAHYDQIRQREEEIRDKQKEAARARQTENRNLLQDGIGVAQQIGSAYFQAFQMAIEGTMSLEDALLAATKQILKSIGEELVARGIGKILEGIAEIPSPTAATKIGGGTAMVAFGVGLGAAGAAIPSPSPAEKESPRDNPDTGDGGGPKEITVVFGNPVLTAGTQSQLARGMGRALRGDRTLPSSVGG